MKLAKRNGKLLRIGGRRARTVECVCCGSEGDPPCNCQQYQPNVVATNTGGGFFCEVISPLGASNFGNQRSPPCTWTWGSAMVWSLLVVWNGSTWDIRVDDLFTVQVVYEATDLPASTLLCVDGNLEGVVVLPGVNGCAGQTLTLTFGP